MIDAMYQTIKETFKEMMEYKYPSIDTSTPQEKTEMLGQVKNLYRK